MSAGNQPKPISIHIPPSLGHLNTSLQQFLDYNKSTNLNCHMLAVGACIFAPTNAQHPKSRLLLLQRAATDSYPNAWEFPGGSAESSDPSILHSVARETFEETGLRLTRFVRQVGNGTRWTTRTKSANQTWLKLVFEIEVVELHGTMAGMAGEDNLAPVTLDPEEHQKYAWVTEAEIQQCTTTSGPYPTMTEEQRQVMLQAFALHNAAVTLASSAGDGLDDRR